MKSVRLVVGLNKYKLIIGKGGRHLLLIIGGGGEGT